MSQAISNSQGPVAPKRGKPRSVRGRAFLEAGVMTTLLSSGLFTVLTTVAIIVILFRTTATFLGRPDVSVTDFLFGLQWNPLLGSEKHFGIWPLIVGTMQIAVIAIAVAGPLGLITAIWLSEYASPKLRGILKPVLEIIAGIPTVVLGFFALVAITPLLRIEFIRNPDGSPWNPFGFQAYNAMSAGIAVGILTLPIIVSLSEDALRAVPRSLREASYGLGATRFETSIRVVLPAALSGIVAAFLLAVARCVGETMIVALAAGSSPIPLYDTPSRALDVRQEIQPMTGYLVQIFMGDASNFGVEYLSSYAVAAVLFVLTLVLTLIGDLIRRRYRQAYE
jgi:phosphate transport system permease protein